MQAYITVSSDRRTFYPQDGLPKTENYPYASIAEYHGGRVSLGAQGNWQDDPWGKPEKRKYVEFRAVGPDAVAAIETIKVVLSKPPPASKLGIAGSSFGTMFKYLTSPSTEGQRYRPPGYRPPSRPRPEPTRPKPRPAELPKPQGESKPKSQEMPTINSMFRDELSKRGVLADWDRMNGRKRGA